MLYTIALASAIQHEPEISVYVYIYMCVCIYIYIYIYIYIPSLLNLLLTPVAPLDWHRVQHCAPCFIQKFPLGIYLPMVLRESFPRQIDKKSRGPQGERDLEFSRRKKGQFFLLYFLGLYNNNVSCLRTISGLKLLANPVISKCKLWE